MPIKLLSDTLINQIAAGEMIERPASIIKELAENAMDAGATQIDIELEEGGIKRLVVADNGAGMSAEDLPLALTRHATSKIHSFDDLLQVQTMGFRGEALASIASAALVHINTATDDAGQGWQINAEGGVLGNVAPSHHRQGSTITVSDLFYNIPARRQFLRSATTEAGHCLEACRRLALVHAHIKWRVRHNARLVLDAAPYPREAEHLRWRAILGEAFFAHSRMVDEQLVDSRLRGALSLPSAMESAKRDCQYLFVNNRFVRDRTLLHAVREGYAEMKHDAKQLAFALWLDIPADSVDVNVSPMKTEVRFRAPAQVHQLVRQSIRKALAGLPGQFAAPTMSPLRDFAVSAPLPSGAISTSANMNPPRYDAVQPSVFQSRPPSASISAALQLADINATSATPPPSAPNPEAAYPLGHALGLLHHLYILAQNQTGMVVVEIHAAHERLLFEHLKQRHASDDALSAQSLLVPWNIGINAEEAETFTAHQMALQKLGLHATLAAKATENSTHQLTLHAVPSMLPELDYPALMHQLLHDFAAFGHSQLVQENFEQVLASMACHGARRGRQSMSLAEMDELLRDMEKIDRSGSCNHGRPSYSVVPLASFDQFFMRGQ